MAINYPGNPPGSATDTFTVPSDPEGTPLSEAGTGTRDLTESVQDEGLAIMALQAWAALRTHDHSGDGSSTAAGAKLAQSNTHQNADTDASTSAIHHTLDPTLSSLTKAAPAKHTHDYNSLPNVPLRKCTSTTRPTGPTLGDTIIETDTNRWRMWSQFSPSNVANVGMYGTDDFNRTDAADLGSALWSQTYLPIDATLNPDGTAGGILAIPDGQSAQWVMNYAPYGSGGKNITWPPSGWPWPYVQGRCIAQRINATDRHTLTDDQVLTWEAGPVTMPWWDPWPPNPSANDIYLRMSDDKNTYCRVAFTYAPAVQYKKWLVLSETTLPTGYPHGETILVFATTTGVTGEQLVGSLSIPHFDAFSTYQIAIQGHTLSFYIDTAFVGKVIDTQNLISTGASYRGWGIGMTVGREPTWENNNYSHPNPFNQVWINDAVYYTGSALWQLLPVGATPVLRLSQSVAHNINHAGTLVNWNVVEEDNFGFFNPAASLTNITVTETGVYDIDLSLQWGTTYYPDTGTVVVLVNGQETTVRQNVNAYTQTVNAQTLGSGAKGSGAKGPHYSATVPCSGKLRLSQGDVVSVNVYYTTQSATQDLMTTYADVPAKVQSHLEMHFIGP